LAISIPDKMEIYVRAFLVGTLLVAFAIPATASAFWNGTVIGVKNWDVLNVRKWPSSQSQIIDAYDNGDDVSLTGRCKNTTTNWSFQIDGAQSSAWKHARMSKSNIWCQVSSPNNKIGWVRGQFVWPN
jgi:uncharacterized protein YgiM (DUF1202 family)